MKVILLPTLLFGIFFAFASADAQLLGGVAGNCATAINNQSAAGEDYCNAQKKCSKNDLITKFIPTECKLQGLGNITLGNWEKNEDAAKVVKHFQNEGWLSDILPATEAGCIDPRPYINLQDCKSTAEVNLGIRKVNGVDTCCALEVSTNIEKAQDIKRAALCGGGYDYKTNVEAGQRFIYNNISKEELNIAWPKSPIGTNLMEEKDGRIVPITIPKLVRYIYEWLISLGGFAAFVALVIAGVQYLTSAGNPGKMSEAISKIRSAGIGLVLLLSSVLILNTINPVLINLGITGKVLDGGPALNLEVRGVGKQCGTVCRAVQFCREKDFKNCTDPVPVGEGITIMKNTNMTEPVKSIKFLPYEPEDLPTLIGDCVVVLYQFPKGDRLFTDEKPPSSPFLRPIKDIGADGFPMKSFQANDVSRSSGFFSVSDFKQ